MIGGLRFPWRSEQSQPILSEEHRVSQEQSDTTGMIVSFCSHLPLSKEVAGHVAIVAALVCALFLAAVNANFIFLLVIAGGALGEGYFVYNRYKEIVAQRNENVGTEV